MCQITSGDHRAPNAGLNLVKIEVKVLVRFTVYSVKPLLPS